jgi:sugar lactone lactonase YvrE
MVFFVGRTGDANPLLRQLVGRSGAPIGDAVEITVLEGNSDGLTLDECGNLYVIDQDAGRLERLDLDDMGELEASNGIVPEIDGNVSNALFAYGDPVWETTLFITGIGGSVFYVDVGRRGEQVPVLAEAPAVLPGDTTSTG